MIFIKNSLILPYSQGIRWYNINKTSGKELQDEKRADYMLAADYSEGSAAEELVKAIIDSVAVNIRLRELKNNG